MIHPLLRSAAVPLVVVGLLLGAATAAVPAARPSAEVGRVVDYDLGSRAFSVASLTGPDGRPAPMELRARVHLPADVRRGRHPVVVLLPGYWPTCADPVAQRTLDDPRSSEVARARASARMNRWPCAKGTPAIPSFTGLDAVARRLAGAGDVVVSISANGANAIDSENFQGDAARAALLGEHLRLWRRFVARGTGPLERILPPDVRPHIDLRRVGLVGHSRAGRAGLQYAADTHRSSWPAGVRIAAVLALAPASDYGDPASALKNTRMPVAFIVGSCDSISNPPFEPYFALSRAGNPFAVYRWTFRGANHDYFNSQWSPSSGQVGAYDDAEHPAGQPDRCVDTSTATASQVTQLTERRQRGLAARYITAFLQRSLQGDHRQDRLLDGSRPLPGVTTDLHRGR